MSSDTPAGGRFTDLRFVMQGSRRSFVALCGVSLVTAVCEAGFLAALVQSVAALSRGTDVVALDRGPLALDVDVRVVLVLALLAAIVRGVSTGAAAMLGPRLAAASRERLRRRLFRSYLEADWATQSSDKSGRLLQTLSTSVNDATAIIVLLSQAVPAAVTLLVLLAVSLAINPLVTSCLIVLGGLVGLVMRPISHRAHRASRGDARARNETASHVAGVLAAGAEISVLGARQGVLDIGLSRIVRAERSFARAQGFKRVVATAGQSIAFVLAATGVLVLAVSGFAVDFAAVGTIAVMLLRGASLAQQVQAATSQFGAVVPFIEQVRTLVESYEERRQRYGDAEFPSRFDIVLDGVEYAYPGSQQPAVRVGRATIQEGRSTAIVGPSGSGKSTLVQLVLRLRAPSVGEIRIGDVAASSIREEDFSARVAYVPQAPHLIPGTIAENIAFFRPQVTREDVVRAARLAHLHEDVERMEQGYDTPLESHVDELSGGQKQRLALARALTGYPRVLVLDEPTSALDQTNEAAVLATLGELRGRCTVVMITHKPDAAEQCDTVLTVQDGLLDTTGTVDTAPGVGGVGDARPAGG